MSLTLRDEIGQQSQSDSDDFDQEDDYEKGQSQNLISSNNNSKPILEGGVKDQPQSAAPPEVVRVAVEPINYCYLDGLRGIGAFIVYLSHFMDHFFPLRKRKEIAEDPLGYQEKSLPDWVRNTPITLFYHGYFWVVVFFILSGFVLTLRFFKIKKHTCVTGGTFRRYLRLMIPLWITLSLFYLCLKLELFDQDDMQDKEDAQLYKIKDKTFFKLTYDSLFNVWYGDNSWDLPVWTLSIELMATFMVYLIAQTVVEYKGRGWIYFLLLLFFILPLEVSKTGYNKLTIIQTPDQPLIYHFPMFIFGVILADAETLPDRPLDKIRNLPWWYKVPWNLLLGFIIISYGSNIDRGCLYKEDDVCDYWKAVTFGGHIDKQIGMYFAGLAVVFLALTSEVTSCILGSGFVQFFGRISYMFYLVHELILQWPENDFVSIMTKKQGMNYRLAVLLAFVIFTPVLVLLSWILLVLVDDPFKDFAYEIDIVSRKNKPPVKSKSGDKEQGAPESGNDDEFNKFIKNSWKIFSLALYFTFLFIVTESYQNYATKESDVNYENSDKDPKS